MMVCGSLSCLEGVGAWVVRVGRGFVSRTSSVDALDGGCV